MTDYEELLDTLFLKKDTKYDLIFFNNIHTTRFGPHLLNLNDKLSDEIIDLYKFGIASQSCIYEEDEWVGLVNISSLSSLIIIINIFYLAFQNLIIQPYKILFYSYSLFMLIFPFYIQMIITLINIIKRFQQHGNIY